MDEGAVADLARMLGDPAPLSGALLLPDAADRTAERQRDEGRRAALADMADQADGGYDVEATFGPGRRG